jgi:hypothetical protein
MSVTEIISQIERMPREEQRKVFVHLQTHEIGTKPLENELGQVSDEFKAIADEVFTKNAELFRKLAQ